MMICDYSICNWCDWRFDCSSPLCGVANECTSLSGKRVE